MVPLLGLLAMVPLLLLVAMVPLLVLLAMVPLLVLQEEACHYHFPLNTVLVFFGLGATPSPLGLGPTARSDHAKASSRQGSASWPRCKYLRLCYDY